MATNAKDFGGDVNVSGINKYNLIGESKQIVAIRRQIEVVSPRNSWVLITGENGTGKEVVARNIQSLKIFEVSNTAG